MLVEDENAGQQVSGHIDFSTSIDYYLETVEPYIADQLNYLQVNDILNAIVGFSHPHCTKRLDVLDLLEARLVHVLNTNEIDFENTAHILFEFGRQQIGSKVVITNLIAKIDRELNERRSALLASKGKMTPDLHVDFDTAFKTIMAMEATGSASDSNMNIKIIRRVGELMLDTLNVTQSKEAHLDYERLYYIKQVINKYQGEGDSSTVKAF